MMSLTPINPPASRCFWTLCLLLLSSCASVPELPWAPVAKDASAGFYDTARLEYRLDAGKLGQPLDVVRVEGRNVAYEQIASSPLPDRSIGTLVIQHPHPAGHPDVVRVTFSIDSATPVDSGAVWNVFKSGSVMTNKIGKHEEVHEVWAMDLPRADWDRVFKILNEQNFYRADPPQKAQAEIHVTINGKETRKEWEMVPELNGLAQRVRTEGQLVAYLRPQALAGESSTAIASVQAYRNLLAKTNGPTASTPSAAAGIVTPPTPVAGKSSSYAIR